MVAATSLAQFGTPAQVVPSLHELRETLAATDDLLGGVQTAMEGARLPGKGLFSRVPFIGNAADDLERAVRIGAAARELSSVDETALIDSTRQLTRRVAGLASAAEADVLQLGVMKANAMAAGTRLLLGGAIAAAGASLLAASVFDVKHGE